MNEAETRAEHIGLMPRRPTGPDRHLVLDQAETLSAEWEAVETP